MKQAHNVITGASTNAVRQSILNDYAVHAVPRLIAEWNYNRFGSPVVDNQHSEDDYGYDVEYFPIESLVEPLRPNKGILKAIAGQTIVATGYDNHTEPHFYTGDEDDPYKYWVSPYTTNANRVFPAGTVEPFVMYDKPYQTNKIVIRVENTFASPSNWTVHTKATTGGTQTSGWSTIATNPSLNLSTGVLTLYYNGTGWSTNKPLNHSSLSTPVAGVMIKVSQMTSGRKKDGTITKYDPKNPKDSFIRMTEIRETNTTGANAQLSLISIEARREVDLSDRLISADDSFEMSTVSQLYPIGTITTNTADIVLSNEDGIFNVENESSPYFGLLDSNVEFTLDYIYSGSAVRQFVMYGGPWVGQRDEQVSVGLEDYSKFLKTTKPRASMFEKITVTEAIWRMLDSVGFNNYDITLNSDISDFLMPVFWVDGEKTVWEILDELSTASQTAIYFDHNNVLRIRRREEALKDTSYDWTLLGQSGSRPADIITFSQSEEVENNHFTIGYKTSSWKVDKEGRAAASIVWEPGGSVVLRASGLAADMSATSNVLALSQTQGATWPYSGLANIEGEIMRFDAKNYVYYTGASGNIPNYVWVKSQEEKELYDKKTPVGMRFRNNFTGKLRVSERGIWNTHAAAHTRWEAKNKYQGTKFFIKPNETQVTAFNKGGFSVDAPNSQAILDTPSNVSSGTDWMTIYANKARDQPYRYYGAKMKFLPGGARQRGGLVLRHSTDLGNGYYIELTQSDKISAASRAGHGEIAVWSIKKGNREWTRLSKGAFVQITNNIPIEITVELRRTNGGQDRFIIYANGQFALDVRTTDETRLANSSGVFGVYARGKTKMAFDYLYAHDRIGNFNANRSFFNRVRGGYESSNAIKDWVHLGQGRRRKKNQKKIKGPTAGTEFFDEFGAIVHEMREFDVKFDPAPVQYAWEYCSNDYDVLITDRLFSPFGGKFVASSISRFNGYMNGGDPNLRYPNGGEVNQVLAVYGRDLEFSEDEEVVSENTESIRRNGLSEVEMTSDWIQSKGMAEDVGNWMKAHWGGGIDNATVEIFGNPLLEIGDIVQIDYASKSMSPSTHIYHVVGTSTSFETGMTTTLTLRRHR